MKMLVVYTYMRTQERGAGLVAKSLNVRGEEICTLLGPEHHLFVAYTYLIWGIADADVEVWKLGFHHISQNDIQPLLVWGRLETLGDFCSHTRIQFHSDAFLCLFQNLGCQITSTGTDFKNDLLQC